MSAIVLGYESNRYMDAVPAKLSKFMGGDGWGFNGWEEMIKEYIKVQLADLIPHARNPRKNDGAVEAVSKSIKETGYITPIIVDEKNEILCGHTRCKALKKLGHSEVEVLKVEGLTDEQKKRYRVSDNKTGEVAEWDFEILQEDFKLDELVDLGFDLNSIKDSESELPIIEDSETPKFEQVSFILAAEQALKIKSALNDYKKTDGFKYLVTFGNENSNGNALYGIIQECQK